MGSFKQIPKRLLIHEIIYTPPKTDSTGEMGGGKQPEPITISNVRFTDERKKVVDTTISEDYTTGKIYIDSLNSSPFTVPNKRGTITFRNEVLKIVSVNIFETIQGAGIHHIEVEVV